MEHPRCHHESFLRDRVSTEEASVGSSRNAPESQRAEWVVRPSSLITETEHQGCRLTT